MADREQHDHPVTQIAFVFAVLFAFHVMLIPVFFGFQALNPFGSSQSMFAAFPGVYLVSAISTLVLAILFLVLSGRIERNR